MIFLHFYSVAIPIFCLAIELFSSESFNDHELFKSLVEYCLLYKKGIINCHPGDLPFYRGASSPEYQLINKKPVKVSFHYIDEKIDAGHIIYKTILKLNYKSYSLMRSTIYKEIAKELVYVISNLNSFKKKKISLKNSSIRSYIGKKKIDHLKKNWEYYSNLKKIRIKKRIKSISI